MYHSGLEASCRWIMILCPCSETWIADQLSVERSPLFVAMGVVRFSMRWYHMILQHASQELDIGSSSKYT